VIHCVCSIHAQWFTVVLCELTRMQLQTRLTVLYCFLATHLLTCTLTSNNDRQDYSTVQHSTWVTTVDLHIAVERALPRGLRHDALVQLARDAPGEVRALGCCASHAPGNQHSI